jgi:N-acetylmuramoyl-L-alanine amidase
LIEKQIVLSISVRLADRLESIGHQVQMSRSTDVFLALQSRADQANEWLADIFLSVHLNADPDPDEPGMPEAKGSEFWIYPGSIKGLGLATLIDHALSIIFPNHPARGIKEANFAVLRLTKMPAVLMELAFIDTIESGRLKDPEVQEQLAISIADGVTRYSSAGVV